jgi:CheY-like chemotaxis protein
MKILIAEDDIDLISLYRYTMERRNHEVVASGDGEECLNLYYEELERTQNVKQGIATKKQPFDAVILDHKMPKINGLEVAREILAVNPNQRVIFASAFTNDIIMDSAKDLRYVEAIQKPFRLRKLVDNLEYKEIYSKLKSLKIDVDVVRALNPTHGQIKDLLCRLGRVSGLEIAMSTSENMKS